MKAHGSEALSSGAEIDEYYRKLDRRLFLDDENIRFAGIDAPLPIGFGQTISQPSLVLEMTKLLMPGPGLKVLEIGTGSGYQTALLSRFFDTVYTIELVPELYEKAKTRFSQLGFENIRTKLGDGSAGWPEESPFDRIIVTAGAGVFPDKLAAQLKNGGRMVIPVGSRYSQQLVTADRDMKGNIKTTAGFGVVFVEFKGKYGFSG